MAFSIQLTQPARQDARDYAAILRDEQDSPGAARRWLDGLYTAIQELAEAPYRFAVMMVHRIYHGARHALAEKGL